ncbi:MAG TPA: CDP-glucose 4,6-dehydratase [Candidatus Methylacidiphilales bacterium]|jgi:CDP-glucose 4,6-dehydratase|nr:CDP-glucose 4,6-dehydratase [Candidatus Methylacidiphilales bacterium]
MLADDLRLYAGKRVLVTGHTGFKGAWLCEWLLGLGAEVYGLALPAPKPSLFFALELECRMKHAIQDIRDLHQLQHALEAWKPEIILHLAAQALVRVSYREPVATFATNALGTANLLEAVRVVQLPCSIVAVTTDKCYENHGHAQSFKETDPLGGHDPYSASKAAAEIIVASYRDSFFAHGAAVALASARAGNVIGGGDWAEDRIVPDAIRALSAGKPIPVRNPDFTRPWQHVLEPLGGYLVLGARLDQARAANSPELITRYAQAFNFGPEPGANRKVREVVEEILKHWPGWWEQVTQEKHLKEAPLLSLAIDKARDVLGWAPRWDFARTVAETIAWYRTVNSGSGDLREFTQKQIASYVAGQP